MKKLLSLTFLACLPLCGCPPVVVETAPPPAVEVEAAPASVDVEYYYVGGVYYYWHPGYNHWVVYHGIPDRRYAIHRYDRLPDRPLRREVRRDVRRDEHRDEHHDDDHR